MSSEDKEYIVSHQDFTAVSINNDGFLQIFQQKSLDMGQGDAVILISYANRQAFLRAVREAIKDWG